jgi:plasmid stabilization system protein ParE
MSFSVIILPQADAEVMRHTAWIHTTSGAAAATRWRAGLFRTVVTALENDPHRYPQSDLAAELEIDLREMLYGHRPHVYRVLFTIDGKTVYVHRIRHASQDRLTPGDI